jgi:protein SCO1/2
MPVKIVIVLLILAFTWSAAFAHDTAASRAVIGIDERLGRYIPQDTTFLDENGAAVNLRDAIDKPTIIAPVYLSCMHVCPLLLSSLAEVLGKIDLVEPGKDFQVLTLSFDDKDTPAMARDKKRDYLKAIGGPFPPDAWRFLTGSEPDIRKFTESIGFTFQRDGERDFSHPVTLVVIAPGGQIVRYIEGLSFLPFEVTMALHEAARGQIGSSARSVLMYCFSYDPLKKSYVFNILKVAGAVMSLFVGLFLAYLLVSSRKARRAT